MNSANKIFGACIDLGAPAKGCSKAPEIINKLLKERNYNWNIEQCIKPLDIVNNLNKIQLISEFSERLSSIIYSTISVENQFTVIGGDHSIAIGTWSGAASAMRAQGNIGLIWVDAHMDSHTLETTPSGAIHGMPLAALLGIGHKSFTEIGGVSPKILPENVCLIGARSYESAEFDLLKKLGVKIFFMSDIEKLGFKTAFEKSLSIVKSNTVGFGISIDMDAIDPKFAPGVGSPAPNGLEPNELIQSLKDISHDSDLLGIEIVEFNPLLDKNNMTANLVIDLLMATC